MSGTSLDTSGGDETDQATAAQVEAAQALAEAAQPGVTHEATVNVAFPFSYNNCIISYFAGQQIIADAGLYAALNASPTALANITWND